MSYTAAPYANSSMIIPIDEDDMFISNVPRVQTYDYEQTGVVTAMDGWASHVSSLGSNTVSVSTDFSLLNNESIQSLDLGYGGGNLTGYLFMVGMIKIIIVTITTSILVLFTHPFVIVLFFVLMTQLPV